MVAIRKLKYPRRKQSPRPAVARARAAVMPTSLTRAVLRGIRRLLSNRTQEEEAEDDALAESEIEEEEEEYHTELGSDLVLLCFSIVALILVAIWAERRHVPSSLAAVLVGAFLGLVLRLAGAESAPNLHSLLFFDEELFLYLLLPPIIFEAGFSLSRQYFFNNLLTILIFAVLGTLMTTFVVGQACQIFGKAGTFRTGDEDALDFRVSRDAYTFGALISATDPVATLSIMGAYQVDPLMYTLVDQKVVKSDTYGFYFGKGDGEPGALSIGREVEEKFTKFSGEPRDARENL